MVGGRTWRTEPSFSPSGRIPKPSRADIAADRKGSGMTTQRPLLAVTTLRATYSHSITALEDVSLSLAHGEILAILGGMVPARRRR